MYYMGNQFMLGPCSFRSKLAFPKGVVLEEYVLPQGYPGRVFKASLAGPGGIDTTVDYINHQVTLSLAGATWAIRVSNGIVVTVGDGGLTLEVPKTKQVIPVADPNTQTIGYFVAEKPPQADVSMAQTKPIPKKAGAKKQAADKKKS